jgi:hypothetical protein
MPNVVMRILVRVRSKVQADDGPGRLQNVCALRLHKPLSTRVAVFILKTPVFLRKTHHAGRLVFLGERISSTVKPTSGHVRLSIFPVYIIQEVRLYAGSRLYSRCPDSLRQMAFELTTSYTDIKESQRQEPSVDGLIGTAIELLGLQGLQTDSRLSAQRSGNLDHSWPIHRLRDSDLHNPDWHVALTLNRPGAECLMDAVSPRLRPSRFEIRKLIVLVLIFLSLTAASSGGQ